MVLKRFFFIFLFSISVSLLFGQCVIDYSYYPITANYGLDPDSLPSGYVGQFYDEDMTFFLPLDTVDAGVSVTFEDFHITSISLPLGLTWACNNSINSCHYDPAISQYGCVKISGTALIPGNYNVQVDLVATHSLSSLVGPENISFILPLTILPDTAVSSNSGFAMTNSFGCVPITVDFINNNPGMISYLWDFGNGNTSTLENPGPQMYIDTGMYIVQYSAVQANPIYFLESIEVVSGACTDNILIGDVDLLYDIFTANGMVQSIGVNNTITQSFPLIINLANPLQLTGQDVTIDVWDDDGWPWGLEYCGGLTFTPQLQAGVFSSNGGGLSINYTVMEVPANTVTSTDTIYVYNYPQPPNIIYDTLNNKIHTTLDSVSMQWYYYNSPIPGATDTFIDPVSSGIYSLVVVNQNGCIANSIDILVVICDTLYQPTLDNNGSTAWMLDSALYSNLQWYDDNGPVNGANQSFFPAQSIGFYYIVATDEFGCSYSSESVFLNPFMNSESIPFSNFLKIWPNPISNNDHLNIHIDNMVTTDVQLELFDIAGRQVFKVAINPKLFPYKLNQQDFIELSDGLYYLVVSFDNNYRMRKLVKSSR